jgi:hypothetical protein
LPRPRRQIDEYARRARALANELAEGRLSPAGWRDATAAVVRDAHATAAVAAVGPDGVSPEALSEVVADQLRYLDDFAADVASGKQPLDGRLLSRAEMYAQAANATYEETRRGAKAAGGARWERRVLGSDSDHCQDCLDAAARGWQPVGTLPVISESKCLTRCTCHFQYSSSRERPSNASFSAPDFESKHPRDRGKFASKVTQTAHTYLRENGPATADELAYAVADEHDVPLAKARAAVSRMETAGHLRRGTDEYGRDVLHPAGASDPPAAVVTAFKSLEADLPPHHLGMVNLADLKEASGLADADFYDALRELARARKLRLVSAGNMGAVDERTKAAAVRGENEVFTHVERRDVDFANSDFETKHPRARGGKFGAKAKAEPAGATPAPPEPARITANTSEHVKQRRYLGARVRGMADDGVPPARLAIYHATAQAVIDALPAPAATRLYNRLWGGVFYKSVQTLNAEFQKRGGVVPGGQCAGFAQMNRGEVHLDQPTASENERRGVYAHELGHIIDRGIGGQPPVSSTPEWGAAWKEEIVDGGTISDYARTSALEGFAEYWRMVDIHIQDMVKFHGLSQEQAAEKVADRMSRWLPQCTAVLRAHGAL